MQTRRRFRWMAVCAGIVTWPFAASNVAAYSDVQTPRDASRAVDTPRDEMLRRYLLGQAQHQFETRRRAVAALKTPADVTRRQKELRAFFLRSLGDLSERTPLNPSVVGTLERDGYRVEKIIFESRTGHHVTANLYLPASPPPFPGVLVPCGHSDNAKAYEGYQRACILLAKNGLAAFCYDPIGQGERYQLLDDRGKPVIRGTTEHTMAGIGALLVGRQEASYRIWDGLRALDYLASRPEIDPSRLGCTGNSGGGTMTAYLMALDDRIAVAAPSCYITSLARLFSTIGPQDAEQHITGQVAAGMEHADFVTMRAPKPTLLSVGTRDYFDIQGSWDTFREVKLIYGRLGFGERVDLFESDEPHGFTRPRRTAAVRWLKRWLLKDDGAATEPDFPVATDVELQCTRAGQVMREFRDRSVFDLNRERARALVTVREAALAHQSADEFRAEVRKRLGLSHSAFKPVVPVVAETDGRRTLEFQMEPGLVLSALELYRNRESTAGLPVLVKFGADWEHERQSGPTPEERRGHAQIVLADPRGLGMTTPHWPSDGNDSPFGADWREAFMAFSLDRPLLGQRVLDVLGVLDALAGSSQDKSDHPGFHVIGIGAAGPVVLHAALLDERRLIKRVTIRKSLVSWSDVVERGISKDQLATVVPGVLEAYDLPDLAARLAPQPLAIHEPVDAAGAPVSREQFAAIYQRSIDAYRSSGTLELDR
jgi:dienelactone hydrolase